MNNNLRNKEKKMVKPTHHKNAYIFFIEQCMAEKLHENLTPTERMTKLGGLWKALGDDEKSVYKEKAKKDKERYVEEMKNYTPTEEEIKAGKEKKTRRLLHRFKRANAARIKEENPSLKKKDLRRKIMEAFEEDREKGRKRVKV